MAACLYTFIVPIYNVARYLPACLDSILAQADAGWECVCVDDGSTDGSGEIAESYAKRDGRFRVIHRVNGGLSAARNTGLESAHGDYLLFVDADDFVPADLVAHLRRYRESHPSVALCCVRMILVEEDGSPASNAQQIHTCDISTVPTAEVHRHLARSSAAWFLLAAWGKCFDRQIIDRNCLRFDVRLSPGEDSDFVSRYLAVADGAFSVDFEYTGYFCRQHGKSITHSTLSVERRLCDYFVIEDTVKFADAHPQVRPLVARNLLGMFSRLRLCPHELRTDYLKTMIYSSLFKRVYLRSLIRFAAVRYKLLAVGLILSPRCVLFMTAKCLC